MTRKSILIVDDEPAVTLSLPAVLASEAVEVLTASSAEEAERLLAARSFDLVITDLRLTGTGDTQGLDLISSVRRASPGVRVVLLTAHRTDAVQHEALRRGAAGCWSKSMSAEEIVRNVTALGIPAGPAEG
jgi:DNA-binding NarL/FixJ family response regulator